MSGDPSDEAATAMAAMQSFIAVAAHELRNPVSAIVGAAETLDHGWDRLAEADRRRLVEVLARQSRRLSHLAGELLELSGFDSGRADVAPRTLDVSAEVGRAALEAGVADVVIACRSGLTVTADPEDLHRILVNLLVNADTHGGRPIVVEVQAADELVEVRVADAGPGVAADFVPRLFERFTRSPAPSGPSHPGAGLGLAIVAGLARRGGGEVSYRPGAEGGAVFCVRLPAG